MSSDGTIVAVGAASAAISRGSVVVYQQSGGSWIMRGDTIKGSANGDSFGDAVSLSDDGSLIAIGSPTKDLTSSFAPNGRVQIYEWSGTSWVQRGANIDGVADYENFGSAVSFSSDGNVLAIGAPGAPSGGDTRGAARVYKWNTTSWVQVGADITGTLNFEGAGTSVSLAVAGTDTVLAVGSPQYYSGPDYFSSEREGRVRIYTLSANDWGTPVELLGTLSSSMGISVSLSDDATRLAMGAPYDYVSFSAPGPFIGRVMIYENDGGWSQLGTTIVSSLEMDEFGADVALSGDGSHVIIGAPRSVMTDSPNGRVEIYEYTTGWTQVGDSIAGEAESDQFGIATAISSGTKIAVGAPSNDGGAVDGGTVKVYQFGEFDLTPPTVSITSATSDTTNANPISITITFSEQVVGFSEANLNIVNGTSGTLTTSDNIIFIGEITPTADGAVTVDIAAAAAQDLSGNDSEAATQFKRTFDGTPPATLLLNGNVSGLDFFENGVNVQPLLVKLVFYEGLLVLRGSDWSYESRYTHTGRYQ